MDCFELTQRLHELELEQELMHNGLDLPRFGTQVAPGLCIDAPPPICFTSPDSEASSSNGLDDVTPKSPTIRSEPVHESLSPLSGKQYRSSVRLKSVVVALRRFLEFLWKDFELRNREPRFLDFVTAGVSAYVDPAPDMTDQYLSNVLQKIIWPAKFVQNGGVTCIKYKR